MKKVIYLALLLVVPSVAYLWLQSGKNNFKRLDVLGNEGHRIASWKLTDASGQSLSSEITNGKIYVADFFFTRCQTICPKMSNQLMRVQHAYRDNPNILLLSYSVDPVNDSAEVLATYAAKHQAKPGKWYFLTGDKKQIYDLARQSYLLTVMDGDGGPDDFIHSEQLVLVDREGQIRGFYDGTDYHDVTRLIGEIKVLLEEYRQRGLKG